MGCNASKKGDARAGGEPAMTKETQKVTGTRTSTTVPDSNSTTDSYQSSLNRPDAQKGAPGSISVEAAAAPGGNGSGNARGTPPKIDPGVFIMRQKARLSDRFILDKKLGSGAYGEVLLCRDKQTGQERAVKRIRKADVKRSSSSSTGVGGDSKLLEEVELVKQLDHPNIMKLYDFFEDSRNYYLVMEVYHGGELFDEIISRQRFTESDAACTVKQILSGVKYLHKNHIVHRDLKPENLLLESRAPDAFIKIVDFGLSAYFNPTRKLRERLGTAYYIAPEVLKQKYDEKCDIWSIGVILYILLCGYPPFGGNSDRQILRKVERGKFYFNPVEWGTVSDEAKDLIVKMLAIDPCKRISAEDALSHPFMSKILYTPAADTVQDAPVLLAALSNMRRFQASQKLALAAFVFIGSKLITADESAQLARIFRKLDENGDGQLDRRELIQGYKLLNLTEDPAENMTIEEIGEEVDKILAEVDFDNNGFVEYSEFITVAMDRKLLLSKDRLRAAFRMFDYDGSGTIAAGELRRFLPEVDNEQWEAIISEVDTNRDGEVDFEEFVVMMQRIAPATKHPAPRSPVEFSPRSPSTPQNRLPP